jgi:multiple sugar transport system ATP-binding protein
MVRHPAAFLFDEPLSNLDAQLRAQMRVEIKKLHQRLGTTIVYVTHDQVEAMTMADRIVVMREGHILQAGEPMHLYDRPHDVFTARFIGSPMMNILPARFDAATARVVLTDASGGVDAPFDAARYAKRGLLIGARPQDLLVARQSTESNAGGLTIEGIVSVVEPLGPETFVHVECGAQTVVASTTAGSAPNLGERVRARAPVEALKFFDAASETAL